MRGALVITSHNHSPRPNGRCLTLCCSGPARSVLGGRATQPPVARRRNRLIRSLTVGSFQMRLRGRLVLTAAFVAIAMTQPLPAQSARKWRTPGGGLYFGESPPPGSTFVDDRKNLNTSGGGDADRQPGIDRPSSPSPRALPSPHALTPEERT